MCSSEQRDIDIDRTYPAIEFGWNKKQLKSKMRKYKICKIVLYNQKKGSRIEFKNIFGPNLNLKQISWKSNKNKVQKYRITENCFIARSRWK